MLLIQQQALRWVQELLMCAKGRRTYNYNGDGVLQTHWKQLQGIDPCWNLSMKSLSTALLQLLLVLELPLTLVYLHFQPITFL